MATYTSGFSGASLTFATCSAAARGRSTVFESWDAQHGGLHRHAETLDEWLLFQSIDGADFDYTTPIDTNNTGVFVVDLPASHSYAHTVRRRNAHGLTSQNTDSIEHAIDADGALVATPPSTPEEPAATARAGGVVRITANYRYLSDGADAGDTWRIWITTDGSAPNPAGAPTATATIAKADGIGKLVYDTAAQVHGTTVKAVVGVRRSLGGGAYAYSGTTAVVTATADTTGPAQPSAQAFFGGVAAAYED